MALLLLHGFTHTGASWDSVRSALPQSYRSVAPDLRGHGSAGGAEPVTLPAVIEDLAAAAPVGSFTVCGYSMGGRIALHLALAAGVGERVERLVLIGASPGLADQAERLARREADGLLADEIERLGLERQASEGQGIEAVARRWATSTPVLAGQPAEVRETVHRDRLRNTPVGLARALRGLGTGALASLWERLGEIRIPVTLVVGERDAKFRAIAEEMSAGLPHGRVEVVAGAGHAVHLETPERVAALLTE